MYGRKGQKIQGFAYLCPSRSQFLALSFFLASTVQTGAKQSWIFQIRRKVLNWHLYLSLINANCPGNSASWLNLRLKQSHKIFKSKGSENVSGQAGSWKPKKLLQNLPTSSPGLFPKKKPGKSPGDEVAEPPGKGRLSLGWSGKGCCEVTRKKNVMFLGFWL